MNGGECRVRVSVGKNVPVGKCRENVGECKTTLIFIWPSFLAAEHDSKMV